ncbi:MAG TPA: amidase family protein, partial [Mycobacteriales bacterium]|nr:amidase family protein [Mycobacteriales bacterium]
MNLDEVAWAGVSGQARALAAGEVTSHQLITTSLRRIRAADHRLHAFVALRAAQALTEAAAADQARADGDPRPLLGVPVAVKDNEDIAGLPTGMGSRSPGAPAGADGPFTARLRRAGCIIVGKTAMPELALWPFTASQAHGVTRNPWDPARTPGGSSGGSAAAVAAGVVPFATATDGGGSIRIPAACCGLVGLKPARGRVSVGPESGDSFLVCDGVLTRDVADSAAVLDRLAGYEPGDATWAPPPARPFAAAAAGEPGRLRIGLALNPPLEGAVLDPVCAAATHDAAALLESLGHEIEEFTPPWSDSDLLEQFTRAFGPNISLV